MFLYLHYNGCGLRPIEISQIHYDLEGEFYCHKYLLKITWELQNSQGQIINPPSEKLPPLPLGRSPTKLRSYEMKTRVSNMSEEKEKRPVLYHVQFVKLQELSRKDQIYSILPPTLTSACPYSHSRPRQYGMKRLSKKYSFVKEKQIIIATLTGHSVANVQCSNFVFS